MEFCLRSLLFNVVWSTCCFVKITTGQLIDESLPEGVSIFAEAIETKHGGYNISWDVQPPNSVLSVQPKIRIVGNNPYWDHDGQVHHQARYSECLARIHPDGVQAVVIIITFRNRPQPYIYHIKTLSSPSPLSKSK